MRKLFLNIVEIKTVRSKVSNYPSTGNLAAEEIKELMRVKCCKALMFA